MASRPRITVNIFERDLGLSKILTEAAKLRKKPFVKIGVTQKRGSKIREDGKKTTADIAQIHEYGAPGAGIPERSFIRSTVAKNKRRYDLMREGLINAILDTTGSTTVERALGLIGQQVSSDIKNTIRDGLKPALKESTVRGKNASQIDAAKATYASLKGKPVLRGRAADRFLKAKDLLDTGGESTPLIDTGQLINSISYEVVMDGQGDGSYSGEGPSTS